jgi:ketosteroid isomerase-like protein
LTGEASERVRALRAGVEAFNRRDFALIAELLAPDFEFVSPMTTALRGEAGGTNLYRGVEGVRRFIAELDESFEDVRFETDEIRESGDRLLELTRLRARGRGSGIPVEQQFARIWEFRGEKAARLHVYLDRAEALRAAGIETD